MHELLHTRIEKPTDEAVTRPIGQAEAEDVEVAGAALLRATASAARKRKLHVGHFAFMRSVVQGLDSRESWERYRHIEGEATDQRVVRSTIAWIRDEFAVAAKRQDRHGTARLLRIDAARIADPGLELPSLEAFAEAQGLEHESQAEQTAAYEAQYGKATQRLRRKARLSRRQLDALRWLEGLLAQAPRAGDSVAAWLNPTLASRLEAADIFTLAQLVERINGVGLRWHASVKALGAGKAQRIVEWLQEQARAELKNSADSADLRLGRHVALPRSKLYRHELNAIVAPSTDIRPLEKFIVPFELDGTRGLYRRPQAQCLLKAGNDYQAILAWLKSKHGLTPDQKAHLQARRRQRETGVEQGLDWLNALSHTQRAYRKEAERFLLWAITRKGKALSSMNNEDCTEYRDFLADPQPRNRWCGDRGRERWSPSWRPFEGPLSPSAQRHAVTILRTVAEQVELPLDELPLPNAETPCRIDLRRRPLGHTDRRPGVAHEVVLVNQKAVQVLHVLQRQTGQGADGDKPKADLRSDPEGAERFRQASTHFTTSLHLPS